MRRPVQPEELAAILVDGSLSDGDTLLLTAGAVYPPFRLKGMKNLTITADGGPAVIDAGTGHGLVLEGCGQITVEQLRLTGAGRKYHSQQGLGVLILGGKGISVRHCEASGFQRSGFEARGSQDLRLEHLHAHGNGYSGIHVTGDGEGGWSSEVLISHCSATHNPGDPTVTNNHSGNGIVLYHTRDALVEYCDASYNGWDMDNSAFNGPVGIWCANTQRAQFRYCLSHDNRTQWGKTDGGGFDFDGGTRDCLMEYCYSYHNAGAGFMLCQYQNAAELSGNTIRYCASFQDGSAYHKSALYLFDCGSQSLALGGEVYANLLCNGAGRDLIRGHLDGTHMHHNLLLLSGSGQFFNHEYDDSGLKHRGAGREAWGELRFEHNRLVRLDEPQAAKEMKALAAFPRIQRAQELPGYFEQLQLERLPDTDLQS